MCIINKNLNVKEKIKKVFSDFNLIILEHLVISKTK